jgi:hypothetical protein
VAGYNSLEGLLARKVIGSITSNHRLRAGRYQFSVFADGEEIRSGRCHVFVGGGHVVLVDPRGGDSSGWSLDEVDTIEVRNRPLRGRILEMMTTTGQLLTLGDTAKPEQYEGITNALRPAFPQGRPLGSLREFSGLVDWARREGDTTARRAEFAQRGELIPEDLKAALKEPVDAYGSCIYLGSVTPPKEPEGPGFQGFVLIGGTKVGFLDLSRARECWSAGKYADVSLLGWRVDQEGGGWLIEIATNEGQRPFLSRDGHDYIVHHCVRMAAPTTDGDANPAALLLDRVKTQSRHDLAGRFGPEDSVTGLLLLGLAPKI